MKKKYREINVYNATMCRLKYIFNEFEKICVAFSGGKDSGVTLNLALKYAKENGLLNKLCVYHLDYEAQYQQTTDYVTEIFENLPSEVEKYWLCLPVKAQCSTSMTQNYWKPWEKTQKNIWVREMPKYDYIINENNCDFNYDDWDYSVQDNFCNWLGSKSKTCVLVGIRTQESLSRQSAITSDKKINQYKRKNYLTNSGNHTLGYPIYDWETQDVWIANTKFDFSYNKVYDLMFQAGLSIHQMRVASPFNDCAQDSLKLYKVIDPNTWGKMISRVNGVNFTGIYGGTTAMGWRTISKPKNLTWKKYCYFLLNTLDDKTKNHYLQKLETSIKFWKEKGGCLTQETIKELELENIKFNNKGKISKISNKEVIAFDDYLDDTKCTNFKELPTYKRMCICILKNDYYCKYMGFAQTKNELIKRKEAIKKYKNIL